MRQAIANVLGLVLFVAVIGSMVGVGIWSVNSAEQSE